MNYLGDVLKSVVGYPTRSEVKQAHNALISQYESHIGQVRILRNVSLFVAAGGALAQSPVAVIGGIACAAISQMVDWRLQNTLIVVKSNPNYVHAGANLRYTKSITL